MTATIRFQKFKLQVEDLTNLQGPVYNIKRDHKFGEIMEHVEAVKSLIGPVYDFGDVVHHFNEIEKHATDLKTLAGPIYDVERNNHFENQVWD